MTCSEKEKQLALDKELEDRRIAAQAVYAALANAEEAASAAAVSDLSPSPLTVQPFGSLLPGRRA